MATFKAVVFQGGRHLKKDGTTNVKIRVYHNSSPQYIPTEYFIEPDLMNEDGSVSSLSANSENLNCEITNLVQKYRGAYIKLGSTRTAKMSCSELKEEVLKIASPESEFIDFVEFARGIITKTVKRKTANWYESSLNAFIAFYGSERIDAKDIKSKTLESFKEYLENRVIIVRSKADGVADMQRRMEPGTVIITFAVFVLCIIKQGSISIMKIMI